MDGAEADRWSPVAADWAELWGDLALPVWRVVIDATRIGRRSCVLDVGCGSGDFLGYLDRLGVTTAGIDPAVGMVDLARSRLPQADIRLGSANELPWAAGEFDFVTAFNALQFAEDTYEAVAEMMRVAVPGGFVAVANWAEDEENDLHTIEAAVAAAAGEDLLPGGPLRQPGGLGNLLAGCGLDVVAAGLIEVTWEPWDDDALVRGVLLGEDPATMAERAPTVISAASPFRVNSGGYLLLNAFRYAVGRTPAFAQNDVSLRTRGRP